LSPQKSRIEYDSAPNRHLIISTILAILTDDVARWTNSTPESVTLPRLSLLKFTRGPPFEDEVPQEEVNAIFCTVRLVAFASLFHVVLVALFALYIIDGTYF
jgi:hypothetical protein